MTSPPFSIIKDWTSHARKQFSNRKTIRKTTILIEIIRIQGRASIAGNESHRTKTYNTSFGTTR